LATITSYKADVSSVSPFVRAKDLFLSYTSNAPLSSAEALNGRGKWFGSLRQCVVQWEERKGRSLFLVLSYPSFQTTSLHGQGSRKEASAEEKV